MSTDGTTWVAATQTPTSANDTITIRSPHTVTVTASVDADQLTVDSGGTLSVNNGVTFTVADGTGTDLTDNGTVATAGQITNNGQASIAGTLQINEGGFPGGGTGTYSYTSAGTLVFNNSSGSYGVNNDNYWPAANGPQNVNVSGVGGMTLNVARTCSGLVQTSSGISGAGNLTIGSGGTFQLNTGGFVSGSPTYNSNSTLKYNTGGTYGRAGEWLPGATSGAGYPGNVQISNNTTLDLTNGGVFNGSTSQAAGNLTIDSGSTLSMGAMTQALTIIGNVTSSGTLALSTVTGGDLHLQGSFAIQGGTYTHNNRALYFEGGNTQTVADSVHVVNGTFTLTTPYVRINKTANTVRMLTTLQVLGSAGGDSIQFANGTSTLTLNGQKLILGGTVGAAPSGAGIIGDSTGSTLDLEDGGTAGTMGTVTFVSGSQQVTTLTVNRTGGSGAVTFGTPLFVNAALNLTSGIVQMGANTLSLGTSASRTRTSGYIIGTEQKSFINTTSFTFDVGTANGYTPLDANSTVATGTGSLSVKPTQTKQPNIAGTNALSRYWTLAGSNITTNLTFHYLAGDVTGTESNYKIFKNSGGTFTQFTPTTLDTVNHTATLNGVSSFSDWTLAEASSVFGSIQFSSATYSTAEGDSGSHNATITVTRSGGTSGAVSVDYATADNTATQPSDYTSASGTLNFADGEGVKTFNVSVNGDTTFEPNESVNLTLSNVTGGASLGTPDTAVLTITNDDAATISGTKTVCASGCDYVNLTGAAGLFAAINGATVNGNLTAVVSGDLVEDGANALNQWTESGVGNYTLTIQPDGAATRTVSGNVSAGMIRLNGADRVTIDGRFGGTGRYLTFRNTNIAGPTIWLLNDASNDTVRSSVIEGMVVDPNVLAPTIGVVTIGAGTTTGNDNDTINDNQIRDRSDATGVPSFLVLSVGSSNTVVNSNGTISDNEVFNFRTRAIYVAGIVAGSSESWTVSGNNVYQTAARATTLFGISVSATGNNSVTGNTVHDLLTSAPNLRGINIVPFGSGTTTVSRNRLYSIESTSDGATPLGIILSANDTATINAVNNMVSMVPGQAHDQQYAGLYEQSMAGTTVNLFYNSVLVGGTSTGATASWACVRGSAPTASASTWRNNICFNNRTGGGSNNFAAGNQSTLGTFSSDYNVFVGTGAVAASDFMDYGTADTGTPVSFATWQSSTGGDAHSLAANPGGDYTVANMFTSSADLHLNTSGNNPASNAGVPVVGVTTDYDNQTRDTVIPDIGADEVLGTTTLQFSSATYSVGEGDGNVIITVTRTGSSVGIATVHYATSDGTATEADDYGAQTDSLIWQDGDASPKTFNVPINNDTLYEGNETFNVTLTQLNGALGTPSVATVTIVDNDPAPTLSVGDVTVAEPSSGITYAVFPVTLSAASGLTTTVNFATADGSAMQPGDYTALSGSLSFAPGETTKTVAVIVKADAVSEPSETFTLNLSSPTNATVADGTGVATITAPVGAGNVLISEFRLRGPGDPNAAPEDADQPVIVGTTVRKGVRPKSDTDETSVVPVGDPNAPMFPPETDEFIEIYNNTDADIVVTDANPVTCALQVINTGPMTACGWALVDVQGATSGNIPRFVIPVGTIIPARGHFLAASTGYSLGALATPDLTYNPPAYSGGESDYTGLALFKTADRAQFTVGNVFDAVGFDGIATPFREGSGLLPVTGVTEDLQYSFVRNQTASVPSDTGNNLADFTLVCTTPSLLTSGTATLGAPGPENLSGPVSKNSGFGVTFPPGVASSLRSNTTVTNGSLGTLSLRRRFTNNTGQAISKLRFRVVNLTTYNSKQIFANQAEVRLIDAQLTGLSGTGLKAATVETPPAQTSGGGVNSGLVLSGSLTLAQPLAAGQSVDVEFLLGVMRGGSFQFVVVVEGQ